MKKKDKKKNKIFKKVGRNENVLVDQEKNLNIVMEIFNLNFFKCI